MEALFSGTCLPHRAADSPLNWTAGEVFVMACNRQDHGIHESSWVLTPTILCGHGSFQKPTPFPLGFSERRIPGLPLISAKEKHRDPYEPEQVLMNTLGQHGQNVLARTRLPASCLIHTPSAGVTMERPRCGLEGVESTQVVSVLGRLAMMNHDPHPTQKAFDTVSSKLGLGLPLYHLPVTNSWHT